LPVERPPRTVAGPWAQLAQPVGVGHRMEYGKGNTGPISCRLSIALRTATCSRGGIFRQLGRGERMHHDRPCHPGTIPKNVYRSRSATNAVYHLAPHCHRRLLASRINGVELRRGWSSCPGHRARGHGSAQRDASPRYAPRSVLASGTGGGKLPGMTDEHAAAEDAERAAIRDRYRALRAQLAVLTDEEWAAERDAEVHIVHERAARLRRSRA